MPPRPALFLDRDGVINRRLPGDYVRQPEQFVFEPNALQALRLLAEWFNPIVVVTNQAGVGKGLMTINDLCAVHEKMLREVVWAGGRIDGVYFCPHRPDEGCPCRKPATGMAYQARRDFPQIAFSTAWMVGDAPTDMAFGAALGMQTALILGNNDESADGDRPSDNVTQRFASLWDFACHFSP